VFKGNDSTQTHSIRSRWGFKVKEQTKRPVNVAELSETELNAELEKGYADEVGCVKTYSPYLLFIF
jgi:hypothetical protein